MRYDSRTGATVTGLTWSNVESPDDAATYMKHASKLRVEKDNKINEFSSCGHAICSLSIDDVKLVFVDLAGKEQQDRENMVLFNGSTSINGNLVHLKTAIL